MAKKKDGIVTEITIKKTENGWTIVSDGNLLTNEYHSLVKIVRALLKWAKGQNL